MSEVNYINYSWDTFVSNKHALYIQYPVAHINVSAGRGHSADCDIVSKSSNTIFTA